MRVGGQDGPARQPVTGACADRHHWSRVTTCLVGSLGQRQPAALELALPRPPPTALNKAISSQCHPSGPHTPLTSQHHHETSLPCRCTSRLTPPTTMLRRVTACAALLFGSLAVAKKSTNPGGCAGLRLLFKPTPEVGCEWWCVKLRRSSPCRIPNHSLPRASEPPPNPRRRCLASP